MSKSPSVSTKVVRYVPNGKVFRSERGNRVDFVFVHSDSDKPDINFPSVSMFDRWWDHNFSELYL